MWKELKKDRLIVNSWWDMFQQAFVKILALLVGLASARYLGTNGYGVLNVVSAVIAFFMSVSWLGIDSIIINECIMHKEKNEEYLGTAIVTKLLISILAIVISYAFVKVFYSDRIIEIVFLIQGTAMIFQFSEIFRLWFQSRQDFKWTSISIVVVKTFTAIYQVCLILMKKDVIWFATVSLLYDVGVCLCFSWIFFRRSKLRLKATKHAFKDLIGKSYHFIISSIAITLYMQVDKIMIGKMISSSEVGVYSAAVNISTIWQFIPLAIINAARPRIIEKKKIDDNLFIDSYKRLIWLVCCISIIMCLAITILARPIVYLLYGKEYLGAIGPLRVCTWATAFAMGGVIRGIWLRVKGFNKYDKYFTSIAAVINIVLNIYGIKYWDIMGAATATIVSYFIEVFIVNWLFKETRVFNKIVLESLKEWRNMTVSIVRIIKHGNTEDTF